MKTPSLRMTEATSLAVITAVDQAINDSHDRAMRAARRTEEAMLEFANEVVLCGTLLLQRRKEASHGKWQTMFRTYEGKSCESASFQFDYTTGYRYMRVANKHPASFINWADAAPFLRDAGIIAGALPEPAGHGKQDSHSVTIASFVLGIVGNISSAFAKFDSKAALGTMSDEAKEQVRDQLEPAKRHIDELWDATQTW